MSLDDITKEAVEAGLTVHEIQVAKKRYNEGVMLYFEKNPEPDYHRFRSAILGIIHQEKMAQYCGEAYARKYIKEVARPR